MYASAFSGFVVKVSVLGAMSAFCSVFEEDVEV